MAKTARTTTITLARKDIFGLGAKAIAGDNGANFLASATAETAAPIVLTMAAALANLARIDLSAVLEAAVDQMDGFATDKPAKASKPAKAKAAPTVIPLIDATEEQCIIAYRHETGSELISGSKARKELAKLGVTTLRVTKGDAKVYVENAAADSEAPAKPKRNRKAPKARTVGEIVLAKWTDGEFYEAKVVKLYDEPKAKVYWLDGSPARIVALADMKDAPQAEQGHPAETPKPEKTHGLEKGMQVGIRGRKGVKAIVTAFNNETIMVKLPDGSKEKLPVDQVRMLKAAA